MRNLICITILGVAVNTAQAQPFATSVVDFYNPDLPCEHCDPNDTLGPPDATQSPVAGFYSIGGLGWIELEMGAPVIDILDADFAVWEELTAGWDGVPGSVGNLPDETADVYLGFAASDWTLVGQVQAGDRDSLFIDIAGSGMSGATFVRIEDVSNGGGSSPGFDLDAVEILPEPATAILLVTSGLFAFRRCPRRRPDAT